MKVARLLSVLTATLLFVGLASAQAPADAERSIQQGLSRSDRELMTQETILALQNLQTYHYRRKNLGSLDANDVIEEYMKQLDYNRLFFLETDREEFSLRFGRNLVPTYLLRGNLFPAFEIFDTFHRRTTARLEWVEQRLQQDFDFSTDRTFTLDRSEQPWPKDPAAADELWERRLTFELLQEVLGEQSLDEAKERIQRRYRRIARFYNDFEPSNVQENFISAVTSMLDPHSQFLSASSMEDLYMDLRNSLVGIGALLRDEDGICTIQELIPGGPAELSGMLHPGDKIIEVAQGDQESVDVIDMKLSSVVKMIRGEKGTPVRLTIRPGNATDPSERRTFTLIRDEIKLTANLARASIHEVPMDDRTVAVGVIELPSFYGSHTPDPAESSTTRDVEELIGKLKERNIQGLVLDLRRNPGGLLNEAVSLSGLFIPRGPVVQIRDTSGRVREDWDRDSRVAWDGPLVVLTSRRSASASEIVAGALQDHGRAIVVGDARTHGKGTVQMILELNRSLSLNPLMAPPRLGATKVTIQKFYLPFGESTQHEGVKADVPLPSISDHMKIGESDLTNALPWDAIPSVEFNPSDAWLGDVPTVTPVLRSELLSRSRSRQETLPEFQHLAEGIARFAERQERTEISLNLEERRRQREEDRAFAEAMRGRSQELARDNFPREEVKLEVSRLTDEAHQETLRTSLLPNGMPRAGQVFQKVFYYLHPETGDIREVWIERVDYAAARKHAEELARVLSEVTGAAIPEESMSAMLQHLENADRTTEFQIEATMERFLGEHAPKPALIDALPTFYSRIVELDPSNLGDHQELDIPLREGLRIVADWLDVIASPPSAAVARREDRAAPPPAPAP